MLWHSSLPAAIPPMFPVYCRLDMKTTRSRAGPVVVAVVPLPDPVALPVVSPVLPDDPPVEELPVPEAPLLVAPSSGDPVEPPSSGCEPSPSPSVLAVELLPELSPPSPSSPLHPGITKASATIHLECITARNVSTHVSRPANGGLDPTPSP